MMSGSDRVLRGGGPPCYTVPHGKYAPVYVPLGPFLSKTNA
jgi:hypothetical protein